MRSSFEIDRGGRRNRLPLRRPLAQTNCLTGEHSAGSKVQFLLWDEDDLFPARKRPRFPEK